MTDPTEDLIHALAMEAITVPSDPQVVTYFVNPTALEVMPSTTVVQGGVNINVSNLCPIPLAWAPYGFQDTVRSLKNGEGLDGHAGRRCPTNKSHATIGLAVSYLCVVGTKC